MQDPTSADGGRTGEVDSRAEHGQRTAHAKTEVTALVVAHDDIERESDRRLWLRSLVRALAQRFASVDHHLSKPRSDHPDST